MNAYSSVGQDDSQNQEKGITLIPFLRRNPEITVKNDLKEFSERRSNTSAYSPVAQDDSQNQEKKNSLIPILRRNPEVTVKNHLKEFSERRRFNWTEYNDFDAIVSFLYEMRRKFFHLAKIINIGNSYEGRPILVLRVAASHGRLQDKIFIEGGIHAREWISPASVTYMIHRILHRWTVLPKFMKNKVWLFLPVLNPDGYVYSWKEDRLWRKNRSKQKDQTGIGVDLNRNFPVGWDKNTHTDSTHLNYKGPRPFSEPETQAVRDYLFPQKKQLKAYISLHSYGQEIRYLWNFTQPVEREDRVTEIAKRAAENMRLTTGLRYDVLGRYATKAMFGNSRDWARKILNIDYAYLLELRDKGENGFILPGKEILPTAMETFEFVKTVAQALTEDRIEATHYRKLGVSYRI